MKTNSPLHIILAGGSCFALLVYVLACTYGGTSFSPDDRQVLYPSFDQQNGALSVALYDRDKGRSEQIYSGIEPHTGTNIHSTFMHVEWLPDGKHILVAQSFEKKNLSLFIVPHGVNEPLRQIHLADESDDEMQGAMMYPFAMAGTKVFISIEHKLTRVDWVTGKILTVTNQNDILAFPAGDGKTIIGFGNLEGKDQPMQFGIIDPETLVFIPHQTLKTEIADGLFPYFDPVTGEICLISGGATNQQLHVFKDGKETFTRRIGLDNDHLIAVGPRLDLGSKMDRVFTSYISQTDDQTNLQYGLMEIPLDESPIVFTPLFHLQTKDFNSVSAFAQSSLSHDGRIWAVSSAWLGAVDRSLLQPEDSALYLVQVDRSRPKVTKVPIPLPVGVDDFMK